MPDQGASREHYPQLVSPRSPEGCEMGLGRGAGVEYGITRNWSFKVEYDHAHLGTLHVTLTAAGGLTSRSTSGSSSPF